MRNQAEYSDILVGCFALCSMEIDSHSDRGFEVGCYFVHVQPSNPDIPHIDLKIHNIIEMGQVTLCTTPMSLLTHQVKTKSASAMRRSRK